MFEIEKSIMIKTKMLLKITILDEQEPSVQSTDSQSSASLKLRKYVFAKTWKMAVTAYLKIDNGFHERISSSNI